MQDWPVQAHPRTQGPPLTDAFDSCPPPHFLRVQSRPILDSSQSQGVVVGERTCVRRKIPARRSYRVAGGAGRDSHQSQISLEENAQWSRFDEGGHGVRKGMAVRSFFG